MLGKTVLELEGDCWWSESAPKRYARTAQLDGLLEIEVLGPVAKIESFKPVVSGYRWRLPRPLSQLWVLGPVAKIESFKPVVSGYRWRLPRPLSQLWVFGLIPVAMRLQKAATTQSLGILVPNVTRFLLRL